MCSVGLYIESASGITQRLKIGFQKKQNANTDVSHVYSLSNRQVGNLQWINNEGSDRLALYWMCSPSFVCHVKTQICPISGLDQEIGCSKVFADINPKNKDICLVWFPSVLLPYIGGQAQNLGQDKGIGPLKTGHLTPLHLQCHV